MSKLGDQFKDPAQGNETSHATEAPREAIATKADLDQRIKDRRNYPGTAIVGSALVVVVSFVREPYPHVPSMSYYSNLH